MADAGYLIEWVMFDTRDEQVTHAYVAIKALGDCPIGVQGWHYKAFPSRVPTVDILQKHAHEMVLWPLKAPPWNFDRERNER
jgi:hypothetical protein